MFIPDPDPDFLPIPDPGSWGQKVTVFGSATLGKAVDSNDKRDRHNLYLFSLCSNEKSFDNIKNWIRNIEEHASADVEKMILGNKCDMNDRRQVSSLNIVSTYSRTRTYSQFCGSETKVSGSGLKLVSDSDPDSNPDPNPGFESRSETGPNFLFLFSNFYPASSSKIKRLPSLSSMTWLQTRCAINLQDSDSDPLVRDTDPRIRTCTKKSRIRNTAYNYL